MAEEKFSQQNKKKIVPVGESQKTVVIHSIISLLTYLNKLTYFLQTIVIDLKLFLK